MNTGRDNKKADQASDSYLNPKYDFGKKMSRPNFKFAPPETEPREGGLN